MPKFFEVFGIKASELSGIGVSAVKSAVCPFTENVCDGGGNRHQTKITFTPEHDLRHAFDETLTHVVPAVCSVDYGDDQWVVCPRRLMGFKNEQNTIPPVNLALQKHEREALLGAGLVAGVEYGVWSEIYVQYAIADVEIDYHFDFIVAPLQRDVAFADVIESYNLSDAEKQELAKCAKQGGYIGGRLSADTKLSAFPDLSSPLIIEVMTASTSGSNTAAGTNIAAAFKKLILGQDYQGPGINKRQVWGRMATQLFAKSALAEFWGGKTYWLVQDQLLKNIELTTKLKLANEPSTAKETINFISMKYSGKTVNGKPDIALDTIARIKAGISFNGNETCSDILLPKVFPPKLSLLKSMLRRNVAGVVKL